jgi:hypothetical protein
MLVGADTLQQAGINWSGCARADVTRRRDFCCRDPCRRPTWSAGFLCLPMLILVLGMSYLRSTQLRVAR